MIYIIQIQYQTNPKNHNQIKCSKENNPIDISTIFSFMTIFASYFDFIRQTTHHTTFISATPLEPSKKRHKILKNPTPLGNHPN